MHEHLNEHERDHLEASTAFRAAAEGKQAEPGPAEQPRTPRLFRAAATGRTDVLGPGQLAAVQRAVGNSAVRDMLAQRDASGEEQDARPDAPRRSPVHDVLSSGGGQPLDADTRTDFEARLGGDFSDVRVHTGDQAHESARSVGAHAYTVGTNVVFQRDRFDTASHEGRTMLAHELTHVMQQRNGPVDGSDAPGGIRVSDPSDRFEREAVANADRAMAEPTPGPAAAPTSAPGGSVQRAEDEDEQPADVQGAFVQRAKDGKPGRQEDEDEESPGD